MQWHHHLDFNNQGKIWFFGQPFPSGNVWICFSRVNQLCSLGFQVDYDRKKSWNSSSIFRAIIQQPSKFFVENRSKLFEEHNKEYGTQEAGYWRFEGRENLYRGLFNLVGNKSSCFYTNSQTEKYQNVIFHPRSTTWRSWLLPRRWTLSSSLLCSSGTQISKG